MAEEEEEEQTLFIERYPRRKHPLLYQKQPKEPSPPSPWGKSPKKSRRISRRRRSLEKLEEKCHRATQNVDKNLIIFRDKFGLGDEEAIILFVSKLKNDFDAREEKRFLARTRREPNVNYSIMGEEYICCVNLLLKDIKTRNELSEKILTIHRLLREDGVAI